MTETQSKCEEDRDKKKNETRGRPPVEEQIIPGIPDTPENIVKALFRNRVAPPKKS